MGLFGLVTGGCAPAAASRRAPRCGRLRLGAPHADALRCRGAKKRKVQMTFKQKRRKVGKIAKAVARSERETTKRHSAGSRRESKNTLKKLW
jgi:hypothetical protein